MAWGLHPQCRGATTLRGQEGLHKPALSLFEVEMVECGDQEWGRPCV